MNDIREVAKLADVSIATVSNAFNNPQKLSEKTLKRVFKAAKELDYYPNRMASGLAGNKKSRMIGIIVSDVFNISYIHIMKGIMDVVSKYGYTSLLFNANMDVEKEVEAARSLIEYRVAGVVITGTSVITRTDHISKMIDNGIAVVTTNRRFDLCDSAQTSMEKALVDMMRRLRDLGHTELGVVVPPLYDEKNERTSRYERLQMTIRVAEETGLSYDPANLTVSNSSAFEEGVRIAQEWVDQKRHIPSVVYVIHDRVASGLVTGLRRNGVRVPQDVSVIGSFAHEISQYCDPPLDTIDTKDEEMGNMAGQILLRRIEEPNHEIEHGRCEAVYVQRGSVARARR